MRSPASRKRPGDVLGLHFFSPANVMRLLEVVRAKKTRPDVLATAMSLARRIGKTAVVSGVCDGFIGNRMLDPYAQQALLMLEEGASPQQVDRAIEAFGFAMGPFRMSDLAGNDISWHIRKRHYAEHPEMRHMRIADRICELGRFGQKTGLGWYRYEAGKRDAIPDPLVDQIIDEERKALKIDTAQDSRRGDRRSPAVCAGQRGRAHPGGGHRAARLRHRRGLPHRLRLSRCSVVARCSMPAAWDWARCCGACGSSRANPHAEPESWKPARLLAQLAAAGRGFDDALARTHAGKRRAAKAKPERNRRG